MGISQRVDCKLEIVFIFAGEDIFYPNEGKAPWAFDLLARGDVLPRPCDETIRVS